MSNRLSPSEGYTGAKRSSSLAQFHDHLIPGTIAGGAQPANGSHCALKLTRAYAYSSYRNSASDLRTTWLSSAPSSRVRAQAAKR